MLTSKQRAILRGKANTMDPVYIVGKGEIDETMIQGVKDCLEARELIKLKVLESSMYNAREASVKLAEATGADCVQVIGSKFVLYLQKKKESLLLPQSLHFHWKWQADTSYRKMPLEPPVRKQSKPLPLPHNPL